MHASKYLKFAPHGKFLMKVYQFHFMKQIPVSTGEQVKVSQTDRVTYCQVLTDMNDLTTQISKNMHHSIPIISREG